MRAECKDPRNLLSFAEHWANDGSQDAYFKAVFQAVEDSLKSGGALKGSLFWQWYGSGETASKGEGGGSGRFGVYASDSLFQTIKQNAANVAQLNAGSAPSKCSRKEAPPAPPSCTGTYVHGRSGTGFEGPQCDIDINECVRGTAGCVTNAVCVNKQGGYDCVCASGTLGDGSSSCSFDEGSGVDSAVAAYWNDPKGQACDLGEDIPYPATAAGWLDDPTGSFDRNNYTAGGLGSRVPVSAGQCAVACKAAPGCEIFTYNAALQACFLKAKQCPLRNNCQGPELVCHSTSDTGQNITVPCGTWTTYYQNDIYMNAQQYCAKLQDVQSFEGGSVGGR